MTYNYKLAKWLDEKLKPVSVNDHTINDVLNFVDALHDMEVDDHSILVSCVIDVASLFTNVPVDEMIQILAEMAFKDDGFNKQHNLNITKSDLVELLNIASKSQVFQFEGSLYEQTNIKPRHDVIYVDELTYCIQDT